MRYFTFICFLFAAPLSAQTLQGIVSDANTGRPLYAVTVVNVHTQKASITDEHGLYVITANPGDQITFSYVGYKTVEKRKPLSEIIATLNISMQQSGYLLDEFRIRPGLLTKYQLDSMERKAIYKTTLDRTHPNPIMSPASAIAEMFSKKAKSAYQFQKVFAAGEIEKFVDTRYTPTLVTKLTGLTGDSIGHFMYQNPMPYEFARAATDLEIKMWIRFNYKEWLKTIPADTLAIKQK